MTPYYGFALFAVCFGGILFGVGMGLHWGTRVGEKRGQQAAEFAYSYGLLNKTGATMADELAIARANMAASYAQQLHQATLTGTPNPSQGWVYAGQSIGALQGIVGPTPTTWTVGGGGGGAGGYASTAGLPNPLTNYGSAGSQISSKI